jgi:predicted phage terminase large subunit-like protein
MNVEPMRIPNTSCTLDPTEKQRLFLNCRDELEVFFGGAAGGGKSVALLMGAMEFVHMPGYAALILRKDFARLELAGGLIPRSQEWFREEATWVASRRQWIFPIKGRFPATIMFGYLKRPLDKFRYASSEFQYIAFDELTEFTEEDYLFLFSRLRRNTSVKVPLRMRSASNPGGPGHAWVRGRFIEGSGFGVQGSGEAGHAGLNPEPRTLTTCGGVFRKEGRIYIPSRIGDNWALNEEEYRRTLMHLPAVERERLMNGDWSVQERAVFHAEWLRYFVEAPGQLELLDADKKTFQEIPEGACYRFVTIDPAGTSADRSAENRGRSPSYSVVQVWDRPPRELAKFLLLRHQVRERAGFDRLCQMIRDVHAEWRPERIWIENEKLGQAAVDTLKEELPIECVRTANKDKETRATKLILKMEKGEVFFPKHETRWRPQLEAEFLSWTGDKQEVSDQIDAAAYAAIVAGEGLPQAIRLSPVVVRS